MRQAAGSMVAGILMLCLFICTWALNHRYRGLTQDGELYAMQALSRIEPALRGDLYLANTSQDQYSFFSPLYASLMRLFGLWNASVVLFVACRILFFAAAWSLIRRVADSASAWLALALVTVASGQYGAYGVFGFAENYLTARSLAEALVITGLALEVAKYRTYAWAVVALAFFIHPIMTLPGALVLAALAIGPQRAATLAGLGLVLAAAAAALLARLHLGGALQVIDGQWLTVVQQRSQFLFLDEWRLDDWAIHLKSLICLALAYLALEDSRIRRLCVATGIVGAAGIALAWIAGEIGPIALLLQSQPWRWFWLTSFASIALVGPLLATLWQQGGVSRTCATLVAIGWVFPVIDGTLMEIAAIIVWLSRNRLGMPAQRIVGVAGYLIVAVVAAWTIGNAATSTVGALAEGMDSSDVVGHIRAVFQIQPVAVFLTSAAIAWLRHDGNIFRIACVALVSTALAAAALPGTFSQRGAFGTPRQIQAFNDWRDAIPAEATVLPIPPAVGAMFAWFTLGRASYLSLDQSSGVVFSRKTAEEVARRSEVLRPLAEPDYEIKRRIAAHSKQEDDRHAITEEKLRSVCEDPVLGFVITSEKMNFPSILHSSPGLYNGWRMYDCRKIREAETP